MPALALNALTATVHSPAIEAYHRQHVKQLAIQSLADYDHVTAIFLIERLQGLSSTPEPELIYLLGQSFHQAGKIRQAYEILKQNGLKDGTISPEARYLLGKHPNKVDKRSRYLEQIL